MKQMTKTATVERRMGSIYAMIAGETIKKKFPEMSSKERRELMERLDFEEIEALAEVQQPTTAVCHSILQSLENLEVNITRQLADIVLWSTDPLCDLAEARRQILIGGNDPGYIPVGRHYYGKFPDEVKGRIAYSAVKAAHDAIVSGSGSEKVYFDMAKERERYRFLPVEFASFDDVMEIYDALVFPIDTALGIPADRQYIRKTHRDAFKALANIYGIGSRESLMAYVQRSEYAPLSQAIRISMEHPASAEAIVNQIIAIHGEPQTW